MSLFSEILDRQITGRGVHKLPFIQEYSCDDVEGRRGRGTVLTNAGQIRPSPVFYLEYAKKYNKFLASADEEGYICVTDTSVALPPTLDDEDPEFRCRAQWLAHRNAIFDFSWAKDDLFMYTASGDQTLGLWDTSYAQRICSFKGHTGSVKALSVSNVNHDVVASGGRDGYLMLWDSRAAISVNVPSMPSFKSPVLAIKEPHRPKVAGTSRARTLCGKPRPSITAVQFLPAACGNVLASAGVDGCVKMWDLRMTSQPSRVLHVDEVVAGLSKKKGANKNADINVSNNPTWGSLSSISESSVPTLGLREHGVTSLSLHSESCQLLVSLTGGHLLVYDALRPEIGPTRWFGGHTVSSFYVKAAFSPDGSHVVSGSSDGDVYVWQVDGTDGTRPYILKGHEGEVTSPAWCPTDFSQLATAADDCTIKIWEMSRKQEVEVADPKPARCTKKWWTLGQEGVMAMVVEKALVSGRGSGTRSGTGGFIGMNGEAGTTTPSRSDGVGDIIKDTDTDMKVDNIFGDSVLEELGRDSSQAQENQSPQQQQQQQQQQEITPLVAEGSIRAPTERATSSSPGQGTTTATGGGGELGAPVTTAAHMRLMTSLAAPAPASTSTRITQAGAPTAAGQRAMGISNALKRSVHQPSAKRTKQQTLIEALQAAATVAGSMPGSGNGAGAGQHEAKRVKLSAPAGSRDVELDENAAANR